MRGAGPRRPPATSRPEPILYSGIEPACDRPQVAYDQDEQRTPKAQPEQAADIFRVNTGRRQMFMPIHARQMLRCTLQNTVFRHPNRDSKTTTARSTRASTARLEEPAARLARPAIPLPARAAPPAAGRRTSTTATQRRGGSSRNEVGKPHDPPECGPRRTAFMGGSPKPWRPTSRSRSSAIGAGRRAERMRHV